MFPAKAIMISPPHLVEKHGVTRKVLLVLLNLSLCVFAQPGLPWALTFVGSPHLDKTLFADAEVRKMLKEVRELLIIGRVKEDCARVSFGGGDSEC